jgi:hypothetical protein
MFESIKKALINSDDTTIDNQKQEPVKETATCN